ncbi:MULTISPECIES: Rrf2 family transcriptional regulator [unclassified Clostridium]|uniref:RrF2 family transcriptional regulator n=1 Tax=unclassified Clostridium TaxID=2614128 RepID=UPI001C8CC221|nr:MULTISPECIES: Rrf2 family transcriptional regulator [unclassified Clostridium]MBX9136468.1 Rrf2 family transcriptional regulator [Clostridium sp. K12(2020)]MBX9143051.1 Rrf2 family transcriptional regulator [Clostridium sp. K13]
MQLSKFTDYAFRALIYLAKSSNENATVDKLAEELDISTHHLKKVINKLAKTEYIISTKGRNGGLKLGSSPEEINLGKVLLLTEENLSLVECMNETGTCPLISEECKLKSIICRSLNGFVSEMSKYTLKDII